MSTPNPSPTPIPASSVQSTVVYLFAGAIALTMCVSFPCGFGVGRWSNGGGAVVQLPAGKGTESPVAKGMPAADWTWQDLQDHLASKGMKTRRGGIGNSRGGSWRDGMLFVPGEGKPLGRSSGSRKILRSSRRDVHGAGV
jgi:hypothetical protein